MSINKQDAILTLLVCLIEKLLKSPLSPLQLSPLCFPMKKAVFSLILLLVCSPWSAMVWAADKKADPAQPLPIKYPVEIKVDNEELKKML